MGFFSQSEEEKEQEKRQQEWMCISNSTYKSFGTNNVDFFYETFAPKMTYALYHTHDTLLAIAQEATALKAKNEELERRCEEQSRIIEALTKGKEMQR